MNPFLENQLLQTRRQFFGDTGIRLGGIAMASLMGAPRISAAPSEVHPALPGLPHFASKAKAVIYLHMNGGPSQLDTWDYKPNLLKEYQKSLPKEFLGDRITTMTSGQAKFPVAPSRFKFSQHGECGRWVSELLPHTAKIVDDIAVVKTVHTNAINHDPACTFVMTGSEVPGKPSMGSWISYGLGAETSDLPAFVALTPNFPNGSNAQALFSRMWGPGFLPGRHSGVVLRSGNDPVLYLENPPGVNRDDRRAMLDSLGELNQRGFEKFGDPDIQTRISQYEMSYRMQASVPELTDFKKESKATLDLYGEDVHRAGSFTSSALLARRLVERGVRMVQIMHRGWDSHGNLPKEMGNQCKDTDQACAALLTDLKQRGMLDETLIIWGGEFGRTVYSQGTLTETRYGRDHHPRNFCMWMAGGGIKGGVTLGETDEYSYNPVRDSVHINEINATVMHCLGIDHERFTLKYQGLDQRLTGVEPMKVLKNILA
ncbi:MAG: sulfatase [Verrucomicrobiaceae bacterium TMED86]|nr:MAG: sulfatase [Verrucomicrobiaceae bacterium TMED86]